MLGLLQLHEYAAHRGEGLRPEFLKLLRRAPEAGVAPLSRPVEFPRLIGSGQDAPDANADGREQNAVRRHRAASR